MTIVESVKTVSGTKILGVSIGMIALLYVAYKIGARYG